MRPGLVGLKTNHILIAGIGKVQLRSGALVTGGYGLSKMENSIHLPVQLAKTWQDMAPVVAPTIPGAPDSNPWDAPARGVSSLRVNSTSLRHSSVKIMLPTLLRLAR